MSSAKERILEDLSKDLKRKLVRDINEYLDLSRIANLSYRDVTSDIMGMLIDLTASYAVMSFDIEANEFARLMGLQYLVAKSRQAELDEMEAEDNGS